MHTSSAPVSGHASPEAPVIDTDSQILDTIGATNRALATQELPTDAIRSLPASDPQLPTAGSTELAKEAASLESLPPEEELLAKLKGKAPILEKSETDEQLFTTFGPVPSSTGHLPAQENRPVAANAPYSASAPVQAFPGPPVHAFASHISLESFESSIKQLSKFITEARQITNSLEGFEEILRSTKNEGIARHARGIIITFKPFFYNMRIITSQTSKAVRSDSLISTRHR